MPTACFYCKWESNHQIDNENCASLVIVAAGYANNISRCIHTFRKQPGASAAGGGLKGETYARPDVHRRRYAGKYLAGNHMARLRPSMLRTTIVLESSRKVEHVAIPANHGITRRGAYAMSRMARRAPALTIRVPPEGRVGRSCQQLTVKADCCPGSCPANPIPPIPSPPP